jgi:carbonic anhydrase/acetyltransferase-like protein (isoleucine patch superfamily)
MLFRLQDFPWRQRRFHRQQHQVYRLGASAPRLAADVYVQDNACIIGDVVIGVDASVWSGAVIRADNGRIEIGEGSNIQDLALIHALPGNGVSIGAGVSIAHHATVHGCRIGGNCLIGIGAILLDGAVIGVNTIVGAGALVPAGRVYPGGVLLAGVPAKVVRDLSAAEIESIRVNAQNYVEMARRYRAELEPVATLRLAQTG